MYLASLIMTIVLYVFFAGSGCGLNQFFITFNLILCVILTFLCVSPSVQDANPRSGLAQSSMVSAYCTYLITSAVMNHDDKHCNPITRGRELSGVKQTTVVLGALFTFLAIAYSTSRAATQSKQLVGRRKANQNANISLPPSGYGPLATANEDGSDGITTNQPTKKDSLRIQALMAAVEAGAIPASALDEDDDDDDESEYGNDHSNGSNDDERNGTRYNYTFFHLVFAMAACYTAMLLTDW